MATVNWSLQHFTDTAANFTANNPTLKVGQLGIETDNLTTTPKFKIGDGTTAWNALPYFYGGALSAQNLSNVLSVGNTTGNNDIIQTGTSVFRNNDSSCFLDLATSGFLELYSTDGSYKYHVDSDTASQYIELKTEDVATQNELSYFQSIPLQTNIGVFSGATGNRLTQLEITNGEIRTNIVNNLTFAGIKYNADFSANYTNRSLVDKGYVTGNFLPLTLTGATTVNLGANNLTFDAGANTARLILSATNATDPKIFSFRTSGSQRWAFRVDGANDDFAVRRYDNAGAFIDAPISISRTSGAVTFANAISVHGTTSTGATGSGSLVFGTSPTFTTYITTPLIIGGSAVGSTIQYKGTIGNGTSTVAAHQFLVGNNGATTAAQIFNSGQVSIGNYASPTNLRAFTVGQDTAFMSIGSATDGTGSPSIFLNNTTCTLANAALTGGQFSTILNSNNNVLVRISNSTRISITNTEQSFTPAIATTGAITPFTFTIAANTGQTASTEISNFKVTGATKTWATGAITTQRWNYLTANTAAFAAASTITNSYGLYVEAATAGTNATITNNFALGLSGSLQLSNNTTISGIDSAGTNRALITWSSSDNITISGRLGTTDIVLNPTSGGVGLYVKSTGRIGLGVASPTQLVQLPAGAAGAGNAPLGFTSGTNLTTAVAGVMEYNNTFHLTNSDATRRHVVLAPNTTKVTAAAPYTNDGYVVINIGGTDFKVMTTA